jgi:hypothetical protein
MQVLKNGFDVNKNRLTDLTCLSYFQNASSQIYTKSSARLQFAFAATASAQPENEIKNKYNELNIL